MNPSYSATQTQIRARRKHEQKAKRPFPPHKTLAEKTCGIRYEDCIRKYACESGEECWFDSEDYWFDVGPGAPTLEEIRAELAGEQTREGKEEGRDLRV